MRQHMGMDNLLLVTITLAVAIGMVVSIDEEEGGLSDPDMGKAEPDMVVQATTEEEEEEEEEEVQYKVFRKQKRTPSWP